TDNIAPDRASAGEFQDAYVEAGNLDRYSPVIANYIRRYGAEHWEENWYKNTYNRLKSWGFNAIGDWSFRGVMNFQEYGGPIPYVHTFQIGNAPNVAKLGSAAPIQIADPFDKDDRGENKLAKWIISEVKRFKAQNPDLENDPY